MAKQQPLSAYQIETHHREEKIHIFSVIVANEPGVLARIVGLFSGRGYNITSLTVSEISRENHVSRVTIATKGTTQVINQIRTQLARLVPVYNVHDLTEEGEFVQREIAIIKSRAHGEQRQEALRYAEVFGARIIDTTSQSFIFQLAGNPEKIDALINLLAQCGEIEICRSGVVAMARGPEIIAVSHND